MGEATLDLLVGEQPPRATVTASGAITEETALTLAAQVGPLLEQYRMVVIDLAGVCSCDASAVAAFLGMSIKAWRTGTALMVVDPQPAVARVLMQQDLDQHVFVGRQIRPGSL